MVRIFNLIKDIVIVFLSMIAIIVSIKTCSEQEGSNEIAKEANEIAKTAMNSSQKFDIINAELNGGC